MEESLNAPRNVLLAAILVMFTAAFSTASDIYIAQNAAGGNTGADCADAHAASWFNSSSNWGSNASLIGPGTTVHLCGIFNAPAGASNYLTFQAAGTSGSPITLLFEDGAVLTAPYWSGAAVTSNGKSWIVVNGGTNGTIQATANGSSPTYANQNGNGTGLLMSGSSNSTVENLTISNLYVDNSVSDGASGNNVDGIAWYGGSNITITRNTCHDVRWCYIYGYGYAGTGGTTSGVTISWNTCYNIDHCIVVGDSAYPNAASFLTGSNCSNIVYGNEAYNFSNWDNSADLNHHDGIHTWANQNGSSYYVCVISNYIHGSLSSSGAYFGGGYYIESTTAGGVAANNIVDSSSSPANSCDTGAIGSANGTSAANGSGEIVVNNTVVGGCQAQGEEYAAESMTNETFENNYAGKGPTYLLTGSPFGPANTFTVADYNVYGLSQGANPFYGTAPSCESGAVFSGWQSCGWDAHGKTATVTLNSDYTLPSGSPLIGAGANLSSLGITALLTGAPQTFGAQGSCGTGCATRPASGAWDVGAYEYGASSAPAAPTGLSAVVQ
jgi:hypothetical protein